MSFFSKFKGVIGVIVIVVIAFFAYTYFFKPTSGEPLLTSLSPSGSSTVDQDLIGLLLTLKNIKLDNSIFTNPSFQSLQDFGKDLIPEPVGRTNPFAPLGGVSAAQQSNTPAPAKVPPAGVKNGVKK